MTPRGPLATAAKSARRRPDDSQRHEMIKLMARKPGLLLAAAVPLAIPVVALAAEGGGDKWGALLVVGKVFNLAIVIAILVWVARKPLANFYASRTEGIRERLEEARQARAEAERKLAEMEARMGRLDDELAGIRAAAEREGREEYERLLAQAEADAARIVARARQEIEGMTRSAELDLRSHAADLAVRLAEDKVRAEMTEDDRGRLFERFVDRLGSKG